MPKRPRSTRKNARGRSARPTTSPGQTTKRFSVLEKVAAPIVAAIIGGVALSQLTGGDGTPKLSTETTRTSSTSVAPRFPAMIVGEGTDELRARGVYGHRRMTARGALVLNIGHGRIWIQLHPAPVSCGTWYHGTPQGFYFEVSIDVSPATVRRLPIGRRVRASAVGHFSMTWNTDQGSHNDAQFLDQGYLTLTAIDTNPGGYWRGRIVAPRERLPNGLMQSMHGSFAAQWCPDPPGASG